MKLVVAEKPSVGAALAKAIGAREKKKGYMMITTVGTNAPAWACVFNSVIFFIVLMGEEYDALSDELLKQLRIAIMYAINEW